MRHHAQRVYAAVGASGGMHAHVFAGYGMDRFFHSLLHAGAMILPLQAHERRAVEFQRKGEALHTSTVPSGAGLPRRKSSAFIAGLPARCNSTGRIAALPQAMVM